MGGDGGCLITRADCVKTKGYGFTKSSGGRYTNSLGEMCNYIQMVGEDQGLGPYERRRLRLSTCFISQEDLKDPVVVCRLGTLYNKEALIGALLSKNMPAGLDHVRGLKDVRLCQLTWKAAEQENGRRRIVCPITREDLDTGGAHPVAIWSTGAVVSAKALKELKKGECPVTGKEFDPDKDLIPIGPDEEELAKLRERLPVSAVSKKRKAAAAASDADAKNAGAAASASEDAPKKARNPDHDAKHHQSEVYKKMFSKSNATGKSGETDPLGTPCYNRGILS